MKKRFLAILLALCMVCGLLPTVAFAADVIASGKHDGGPVTWEITSDGVLTIRGNRSVQEKTEYDWDAYGDIITRVVVDDGITSIPECAFVALPNLETVYIGNAVEKIWAEAFQGCSKLTAVAFPASLVEIQDSAFYGCTSLATVTIPADSKLETIGEYAFYGSGVTSLTMPASLRTISDQAFTDCTALTSLTLNDGLETIGRNAFSGCSSLGGNIYLAESLINLYGGNFTNSPIESIETYKIVPSMEDNTSLKSVKLLGICDRIPSSSFSGCVSLSEVVLGSAMKKIDGNAFLGCTSLSEIEIPEGVTYIWVNAFAHSGLTSIVLPSTITTLSDAFSYCMELETADLSKCTELEGLEGSTFAGCRNLTTVYLGDFDYIGSGAFTDCVSLINIHWPDNLTRISQEAFEGCTALTELTLPASVTHIDQQAFLNCTNLESITFMENVESFGNGVFTGCESLTAFTIYSMDCTFNDTDLFADCPNLVIYAYKGSTAEALAAEKGIPFGRIIDPSKHYFDEGTITEEPTCTEPGVMTYTCTDEGCGETYTEEIPALGHDFTDVTPIFDAETHTHIYDCTRCDATKSEDCTFGEGKVTAEATPNNLGVREYTCTVCGGSYEETYVCRIYGSSRYDTAYAVADALKEQLGVDEFENIIVASGAGYADALAGSYLAAVKNAPILLVNKNRMEEVAEYIRENLAADGMIYLLGGDGAVPAEMEEILDGFNMKRLSGKNRYETNMAILEEAGTEGQEILICTGRDFPDSLSASAVGKPILLVNKTLNDYQKEFLEESSGEFVIIGGTGAVSEDIEEELAEFGEVIRLGGSGRYETCVKVAEYFFPEGAEAAIVAYSRNFPDGLCGGALAYAMKAPLLLLQTDRGPEVIEYANEAGIKVGAVLGGTSLIDDATVNQVFMQ